MPEPCRSRERAPGVRDASRIPHHVQHVQLHTSPPREKLCLRRMFRRVHDRVRTRPAGHLAVHGFKSVAVLPGERSRWLVQRRDSAHRAGTSRLRPDRSRNQRMLAKSSPVTPPSASHNEGAHRGHVATMWPHEQECLAGSTSQRDRSFTDRTGTQGVVPAHDRRPWCQASTPARDVHHS